MPGHNVAQYIPQSPTQGVPDETASGVTGLFQNPRPTRRSERVPCPSTRFSEDHTECSKSVVKKKAATANIGEKTTKRKRDSTFNKNTGEGEVSEPPNKTNKRKATSTPRIMGCSEAEKQKWTEEPLTRQEEEEEERKKQWVEKWKQWVKDGDRPEFHPPWWKGANKVYAKRAFKYWVEKDGFRGVPKSLERWEANDKSDPRPEYELRVTGMTPYENKRHVRNKNARLANNLNKAHHIHLAGVAPEDREKFNAEQQAFGNRNGLRPLKGSIERMRKQVQMVGGAWSASSLPDSGEDKEKEGEEEGEDGLFIARPRFSFHEKGHEYGPGQSPDDLIWIPRGNAADSDDESS